MKRNLLDYVKANPIRKGKPCSVCILPPDILKQLHDAKAQGVSLVHMSGWLIEMGHQHMNRQRLDNHFGSRHHLVRNAK